MMHGLDAQSLEPLDRTHDVEDGINGPDFVEMHLLRRDAVHAPLRLAQQPEGAEGTLFHPVRYLRCFHQAQQLADVASMRLRRNRKLDQFTCDSGSADVPNRNAHIPYPQPSR